jgi:hypothetical protein
MGVTVSYTAIPPQSTLYQRLQKEKSLFVLVNHLLFTTGLFTDFDFGINPLTELLRQYPNTFKSEMEVDMAIAELRWEVMEVQRVCSKAGGAASLEKNNERIREYLLQALKTQKISEAATVVGEIMFGDKSFSPPSLTKSEKIEPWGLVSRQTVDKNAKILYGIDLNAIKFEYDGDREDMQTWIDFYLLADKNKEEIIVVVL